MFEGGNELEGTKGRSGQLCGLDRDGRVEFSFSLRSSATSLPSRFNYSVTRRFDRDHDMKRNDLFSS